MFDIQKADIDILQKADELLQKYDLWYANYPYANPPATICDSAASIDNLHLWQCANNGNGNCAALAWRCGALRQGVVQPAASAAQRR